MVEALGISVMSTDVESRIRGMFAKAIAALDDSNNLYCSDNNVCGSNHRFMARRVSWAVEHLCDELRTTSYGSEAEMICKLRDEAIEQFCHAKRVRKAAIKPLRDYLEQIQNACDPPELAGSNNASCGLMRNLVAIYSALTTARQRYITAAEFRHTAFYDESHQVAAYYDGMLHVFDDLQEMALRIEKLAETRQGNEWRTLRESSRSLKEATLMKRLL
ncbi:MAG: hypothetical protein R3C28_04425 [Pirellulaceae bacterium]